VRLLVIEDYAPLRESVARGLRDAGYAVDATGDGSEGLWFAENHPYDVILLDLMLPGTPGLDILRKLRATGNTTHVLVLTAKDTVADRVAGLDLGADDYLVKPFAFDELLARVRAMVRRRYANVDPVIRIADLEIDTRARRAKRAGQVVALSIRARGGRSAPVRWSRCPRASTRCSSTSPIAPATSCRAPICGTTRTTRRPSPAATCSTSTSPTCVRRSMRDTTRS
jgi:CheY-like chemotaxis protein